MVIFAFQGKELMPTDSPEDPVRHRLQLETPNLISNWAKNYTKRYFPGLVRFVEGGLYNNCLTEELIRKNHFRELITQVDSSISTLLNISLE